MSDSGISHHMDDNAQETEDAKTLEVQCPVCLDVLHPEEPGASRLPCTHLMHSDCAISLFRHGLPNCPVCRDSGCPESEDASSTNLGSEEEMTDSEYENMVSHNVMTATIPSLKRLVSGILRESSISSVSGVLQTTLKRCKKHREDMLIARRNTRQFEIEHRVEIQALNRLRRAQATREKRFRNSVCDALLM